MYSLAKKFISYTIFEDVHIVASKYNMTSSSSELDSSFLLKLTKHNKLAGACEHLEKLAS